MGGRDRDPADLTPRKAVERYLRRRRADATPKSVKSWRYRLKLFVEWIEGIGLEHVDEIRPYDLDEYFELRSGRVAPSTLEGEMFTLQSFVEYLEDLDAVDDGLSDAVRIPDVDAEDRSDSTSLAAEDAIPLLRWYRDGPRRGSRAHAFLELAWHTGARQSGLRALDVRDVYPDERYVDFRHRPETGTGLKNKSAGERPVGIPAEVVDVVVEYIDGDRFDVEDEHGRAPLLASMRGRPSENTVRIWSYMATQPCLHTECPHGRERETCEWTEREHASKCPSSRSPHPIRTGSITWQRDIGLPESVVAERVDATVETIREHYDAATPRKRLERRRRQHLDQLNIDDDPNLD
ncbi:MAG: tyrosine-type recombinase/integrase [Haloplanus sp.]